MPKKQKKIDSRLNKLFKDIQPEEAPSKPRQNKVTRDAFPGAETSRAALDRPTSTSTDSTALPRTKPLPASAPKPTSRRYTAAPPILADFKPVERDANASGLAINFQTGEQNWATLQVLDETSQRTWSKNDQLLIKQVTDQLSLALENARLFEETRARAEELSSLNRIVSSASQTLELDQLLDTLLLEILDVIKFNCGLISLYDETTQTLVLVSHHNLPAPLLAKFQTSGMAGTLCDYVNQTGQPLGINDLREGSPIDASGLIANDIHSYLGVPLEAKGRILGTLCTFNQTPGLITDRVIDLTRSVGIQIGFAIDNARLFKETLEVEEALKKSEEALKRQNQYLGVSAEIGRLVTSTLDLNAIFTQTVNLINDRFGFSHTGIFVVEETRFNAILREATGEAGAEMKRQKHRLPLDSKSIVGKVTSEGNVIVVNDTAGNPTHKPNPLLPETRAEAAIPLRIGTRIIGALDIQSTQVNAFTDMDIEVLQTLADQIAVAIDNARSFELSQQAVMEMREIDRLKSQFLANMSHELRTPLNSIIGFSRVILKGIDGPVTELQQQDLTAIYNSGQHLLGLINDILDLSKIEAGKMELAFDEVNMADVTNSVLSTVTGLIKDKPITLKRNIQPDLPTVRADAIRIRQVMINLLSNASKFTDEGEISVEVAVKDGPAGHPELMVGVTDTGPGIAPEDQAKLFQAFSQVDDSPTRRTGGSGLGLSISQHLIQMHGGRIGIDSTVGKGSTFFFTLPLFRRDKEGGEVVGNRKVILAIDDDPQVIGLYERYLQPQGYQVIPLTDPSRAVERARQLKPFAITLDIMMPGIDGWQVLNSLKSESATRHIPVIICSILEDQEKGFSLGAAGYLVKPILEEDLVNALDIVNADKTIHEVLVVDDNPDDLRLIGKMLIDDGRYKPILLDGGRKGWDAISANPPQAVILDLFMPELNGFEILGYMRADRRLRDIPVIIISGGEITPEQKNQLESFGQRLLTKGMFNEKELFTTIQHALKKVK